MTCFTPLQASISDLPTPNGKKQLSFIKRKTLSESFIENDNVIKVPCGQCVGCRLERSRQWAIRCMHEASLYDDNCFITLTYDDERLPEGYNIREGLKVSHFQKFIKRLRKKFGKGIRYFHCGEYGEKFGRPHFHAILFNFDFSDKCKSGVRNGYSTYTSEIANRLWPFGRVELGSVTFHSAAYVARYIMKKRLGKDAWVYYCDIDWNTGEILFEKKSEYVTMSRRSGIGKQWIDTYMQGTYNRDAIVLDGKKVRPPKYYDSQYEIVYPSDYKVLKERRVLEAKKFASDNTPPRLYDREVVLKSRISLLQRGD